MASSDLGLHSCLLISDALHTCKDVELSLVIGAFAEVDVFQDLAPDTTKSRKIKVQGTTLLYFLLTKGDLYSAVGQTPADIPSR
ncbi:hypothetical protein FKM82_004510 [Ascaphus truei]